MAKNLNDKNKELNSMDGYNRVNFRKRYTNENEEENSNDVDDDAFCFWQAFNGQWFWIFTCSSCWRGYQWVKTRIVYLTKIYCPLLQLFVLVKEDLKTVPLICQFVHASPVVHFRSWCISSGKDDCADYVAEVQAILWCLLVCCVTSQQHAIVSLKWMWSKTDNENKMKQIFNKIWILKIQRLYIDNTQMIVASSLCQ